MLKILFFLITTWPLFAIGASFTNAKTGLESVVSQIKPVASVASVGKVGVLLEKIEGFSGSDEEKDQLVAQFRTKIQGLLQEVSGLEFDPFLALNPSEGKLIRAEIRFEQTAITWMSTTLELQGAKTILSTEVFHSKDWIDPPPAYYLSPLLGLGLALLVLWLASYFRSPSARPPSYFGDFLQKIAIVSQFLVLASGLLWLGYLFLLPGDGQVFLSSVHSLKLIFDLASSKAGLKFFPLAAAVGLLLVLLGRWLPARS
jgi:hypothetical protein